MHKHINNQGCMPHALMEFTSVMINRRKACSMCCRQCARCDEDFCSVCSILE